MYYKISRKSIYSAIFGTALAVLGFTGLIAVGGRNLLPATLIFELVIFLSGAIYLNSIIRSILPFTIVIIGYILVSYVYSVGYRGAHTLDFFLIYKSFVYLFLLSFLAGKQALSSYFIRFLTRFVLVVFFLKYFYSVALGLSLRPDIFAENNFELMFVAILFYLNYSLHGKVNFFDLFLMVSVFALSGSRSGAMILLFVFLMVFVGKMDLKKLLFGVFFSVVIVLAVMTVYSARVSNRGVEEIDRYVFLMMFLQDISDWSWINYLFGVERISPMSQMTCDRLRFYTNLFSYRDPGVCYSNVLHSYLLRIVYDHGLVGLSGVIGFVFFLLKTSGFSRKDAIALVGIVTLNSMSVSAFNSVYFALGFAIALTSIRGRSNLDVFPSRT
jgi:hypothetical protein